MKKIIVITSIIALFSVACQEEENIQPDFSVASEQKQESVQNKSATLQHNRLWFDNGEKWGCTTHYPGNCLGPVIIRPSISGIVTDLIDKVQGENPQLIHSLFNNQRDALEEFVPIALVNGVIDGQLILSHKANIVDGVTMDYVLFTDMQGNIEAVIPFAN